MATLTTFTAGTPILSADVNANFTALNTESAAGYSRRSAIGNVGTGEDILHSWAMPANTLSAAGDGYMIRSRVVFWGNANTKTFGFYPTRSASGVGGTRVVLNPTTAAPNNVYADLTIHCVFDGVSSIFGSATLLFGGTGAGTGGSLECVALPIAATHVPASIRVVEFTGEATSSNDISQDITTIVIFKAP